MKYPLLITLVASRGVDGHGGAITGYSDTHKVSYKALRGSAS